MNRKKLYFAIAIGVLALPFVWQTIGEAASTDPHEEYVNCLRSSYDSDVASGANAVVHAYKECGQRVQKFHDYLVKVRGVDANRTVGVSQRVAEVVFARHIGLTAREVGGCFTPEEKSLPIS